ncbi:hypothetical protein B0H10DRAFT_2290712 [Mycena sp. CBHHK59/15]|nr:hypothetical protein B0H10DRAFT_2290712 [Mycena sp. CBHHK59/15]
MIPTVTGFIVVLQLYFIHEFSLQRALYILTVLVATYPLFQLHLNQRREPRQPQETAWFRSIAEILAAAFDKDHEHPYFPPNDDNDLGPHLSRQLYGLLGINDQSTELFPEPHIILCTTCLHCLFCPNEGHPRSLWHHRKPQPVRLLDKLFVAYCSKCQAEYYPDRITYHLDDTSAGRIQQLEYDAGFLRVSKHGIWMDHRVAHAQENAILWFHSGWSNFTEWLSDTFNSHPRITTRQSQRLYLEHFAWRLIVAHGLQARFTVPAHLAAHVLAESVRDIIGQNGSIAAGAMDHGCTSCTHLKWYTPDLLAKGAVLDDNENGVVDAPETVNTENTTGSLPADNLPLDLPSHPRQQERLPGTGIIPCGWPVHSDSVVTCNDESHKEWHWKYMNRFSRLSFPGQGNTAPSGPAVLHPELPVLHGMAGDSVAHTLCVCMTYCLQTVQWSCGCPIGWGKCYGSESSPQVLRIIDNICESYPTQRPSFLAYDDACNLLHHIVTQNPDSPWLASTKFIVDAWHYITHRAGDILCRVWCNPAPTNGSQPDLISVKVDDNGCTHTTRAFNTETAEQLNAWLNAFEAQLCQMSDINYDFSVHVLMLLYKELVEKRVAQKDQSLTDEFWEQVDSTE